MRVAVLSDIHANLVALQTVLLTLEAMQIERVWCLGDVVGYGPEPQACADIIRGRAEICLAGNHDLAVAGKLSLSQFNPIAVRAIEWQRSHLRAETLDWLAGLPSKQDLPQITLAHGSPRSPVWEYIVDDETAAANFAAFTTPFCLVGHSHLAVGWRLLPQQKRGKIEWVGAYPGELLKLEAAYRWILNPGSVGQPRDHDPRASFAVLDTSEQVWTWHRLQYDIDEVAIAIQRAGLPEVLGRRLYLGW